MINGDLDRVVPSNSVAELTAKLKTQRGIKIEHEIVPGANHFFEGKMEELTQNIGRYIEERMAAKENEGSEKQKAITAEVPVAEEAIEPDESEE
jgi:dienelactone hydrolase